MILNIYNIPCISSSNQLYFANEEDRNSKLYNFLITSIEQSYFPPFSTNKIKVNSSITNNMITANYLSIEYKNKIFYYFIDSYEYVNDQTIYYNIKMDTIMTFYFDMNFRRFEISRSYKFQNIRENLSKEDTFYLDEDVNIDSTNNVYFIVIQFKEHLQGAYFGNSFQDLPPTRYGLYDGSMKNISTNGLKTLIIPFIVGSQLWYIEGYRQQHFAGDITTNPLQTELIDMDKILRLNIDHFQNDPNVMNMYITRYVPHGITINTTSNKIVLDRSYMTMQLGWNLIIPCDHVNYTKSYMFSKKVQISTLVLGLYPVLNDTNYKKIFIGEYNDLSLVPLELVEKSADRLVIYGMIDYSTGIRSYYTNSSNLNRIKYLHVCNSIENIPLYNDNYNIYLSQNKGSLTTGYALAKDKIALNYGVNSLNNFGNFIGGSLRGVQQSTAGLITGTLSNTITSLFADYEIDQRVKENLENAQYSPDTIKMGNAFSNDILNNLIDRVCLTYKVGDYDDIINAVKYIGYVNHTILNNVDLITMFENTLDGKQLLAGECNVFIPHFNTREIIYDIKERFRNGIRFYLSPNNLGK